MGLWGLSFFKSLTDMNLLSKCFLVWKFSNYDDVIEGEYGYKVKMDDKYGYCDKSGRIILEIKYDDIEETEFGFITSKNGKYTFLSVFDGERLSSDYDYIKKTNNGYILRRDGKYGYCDRQVCNRLAVIYDEIKEYSNGIVVKYENYYGVHDKWCNELISCEYDDIKVIDNGFIVEYDENYKFFNNDGKEAPFEYDKLMESINNSSVNQDSVGVIFEDSLTNNDNFVDEEEIDLINQEEVYVGNNMEYSYCRTRKLKLKGI